EIFKFAEAILYAWRIVSSAGNAALTDEDAADACLRLVRPLFKTAAPSAEAVVAVDKQLAEAVRVSREFEQEQLRIDLTPDHLLGEEFDSIMKLKQVV